MFHAGPKRELLKQLLSKLLASKKDTLEIKIPRSRILAAGSQPEKSETCGFIPPDVKVSFLMVWCSFPDVFEKHLFQLFEPDFPRK